MHPGFGQRVYWTALKSYCYIEILVTGDEILLAIVVESYFLFMIQKSKILVNIKTRVYNI